MAGRHPKAMQPRDEKAHPVIEDAVAKGYLDSGNEYPVNGFASHAAANEGRLSVNRAGAHLGMATPSWVVDSDGAACYKACADPDAPHGVRFRLHSKVEARRHIHAQTGGDPSKLKYNPFKRGASRLVDDTGELLR